MRFFRVRVILLLGIFFLLWSCSTVRNIPDGKYLLTSNKVVLNSVEKTKISSFDLEGYIRQQPNRKILSLFPIRLWLYTWTHTGKEKKLLKKLKIDKFGEVAGEPPVIFNPYLAGKTMEQMQIFLRNNGYFGAKVDTDLIAKNKKIKVIYNAFLPRPYRINSLTYNILDKNLEKIILPDTIHSLIKQGKIFSTDLLDKERSRIVMLLKRNGYYGFNKGYLEYLADTVAHKVNLTLIVKNRGISKQHPMGISPHIKYRIGGITYIMDYDAYLSNKEMDTINYKGVEFIYPPYNFVNPKTLYKGNYLFTDNYYNIEDVKATYNYLWKLNVYKLINIYFVVDSVNTDVLNCVVELTPFSKYTFSTELEGTNSSGNLGAQGNVQIIDRSLFRHAENFSVNVKGAIQRQTVFSVNTGNEVIEYLPFNTIEFGGNAKISIPKFWLPLNSENFVKKYSPRTYIKAEANYQRRPEYENEILKSVYGYSWKINKNLLSKFQLLELNSVKVFNITPDFEDRIRGSFLEASFVDHIIAATSYQLFFSTPNVRRNSYFLYSNIESSGNILSFLNRHYASFMPTNDIGQYLLFNLPYSQYVKADLDLRYYHRINSGQSFAYRLFVGAAYPYGNMRILPFEKRYYAGGANGIRAWEIRTLGPGSYRDTALLYPNQSADMKLLFSWEYRFHLFWVLNSALFVDAGNIWALSPSDPRQNVHFFYDTFYKQIAVGSGIGFRFDFTIFVFRLDFAMKMRDPALPEGSRWLPIKREPSLANFNFNIGIGYPF